MTLEQIRTSSNWDLPWSYLTDSTQTKATEYLLNILQRYAKIGHKVLTNV